MQLRIPREPSSQLAQEWLREANETVIVVSHDRAFMDAVCTHILHVEGRTSEWIAAAGGPLRGGAVGPARDLGGLSPTAAEAGTVVLYPNPVTGPDVTVRFTSPLDGTARITLYNLEGEPLADNSFAVTGGSLAERTISLPGIASGLYVCRLQWPTAGGHETRTMTLAVER